MRFGILFFILIIQLDSTSAYLLDGLELVTAAAATTAVDEGRNRGYECGNTFFSDLEVNEVLSMGLQNIDKGYFHPQRFYGPLYSDVKFTEYFQWPIAINSKIKPSCRSFRTPYLIIFTRNAKEVVDVITRLPNVGFAKCIRRDYSQIGPLASISDDTNGYLCAYEFISDDIIQESIGLAKLKDGKKSMYPTPYVGLLYPKESEYIIWPIYSRRKVCFRSGYGEARPFFLLMNKSRELVDVLVKGFSDNYLRCTRSRKLPMAPKSDKYSKLFVQPPRSGYMCGKIFFDDETLKGTTKFITSMKLKRPGRFPEKIIGALFNEPCLVWPISSDGSLKYGGQPGPYRIVFSLNYMFRGVAIHSKDKYEVCDKRLIKGKKNHDTSDYLCHERHFSHQQLVTAAENGCENMKLRNRVLYPASYQGPRFEKDGPYYTYPVFMNRSFKKHPGPDRVVMNSNCEVVGALTTISHKLEEVLVKCHRLEDNPQLNEFTYHPNQHISEKRIKN